MYYSENITQHEPTDTSDHKGRCLRGFVVNSSTSLLLGTMGFEVSLNTGFQH